MPWTNPRPAAQTFRDFQLDGSVSSGVAIPRKSEVRETLTNIETQVSLLTDGQTGGVLLFETWTALAASSTTGLKNGSAARVATSDGGTHTDPVVGGTVANEGEYRYSLSPAGWRRVGTNSTAALQTSYNSLQTEVTNARNGNANLKQRIDGVGDKTDTLALRASEGPLFELYLKAWTDLNGRLIAGVTEQAPLTPAPNVGWAGPNRRAWEMALSDAYPDYAGFIGLNSFLEGFVAPGSSAQLRLLRATHMDGTQFMRGAAGPLQPVLTGLQDGIARNYVYTPDNLTTDYINPAHWLWPENWDAGILMWGQSNVAGTSGDDEATAAYSSSPRDSGWALMLSRGIIHKEDTPEYWSSAYGDLKSQTEWLVPPSTTRLQGETILPEMCNQLLARMQTIFGEKRRLIGGGCYRGGYDVNEVGVGSQVYKDMIGWVRRCTSISKQQGRRFVLMAVPVLHGESDRFSHPDLLHKAYARFFGTFVEEVMHITGQTITPKFMMYAHVHGPQPAPALLYQNSATRVFDRLCQERPHLFSMIGPNYGCEMMPDGHHSQHGYRELGFLYGKAAIEVLTAHGYTPCRVMRAVPTGPKTARLFVHVPHGNSLVRDETGTYVGYPDTVWTTSAVPAGRQFRSLAVNQATGRAVAVASDGVGDGVMTSDDSGATWTSRTPATNNQWYGVAHAPALSLYAAVAASGTGDRVMTSPDGITWTSRVSAADNSWRGICWSPQLGLFVAVAASGGSRVMTSPDGINWTARTAPARAWANVIWVAELNLFVAVATDGVGDGVMTSPDGITWTSRAPANNNQWQALAWSPELGLLAAVALTGTGNRVMTSPDGITWTARTSASDNTWYGIVWAPECRQFVAVSNTGAGSRVMTSRDGITWVSQTAASNQWLALVWAVTARKFIAVGNAGTTNGALVGASGVLQSNYIGPQDGPLKASARDGGIWAKDWQGQLGVVSAVLGPVGTDPEAYSSIDITFDRPFAVGGTDIIIGGRTQGASTNGSGTNQDCPRTVFRGSAGTTIAGSARVIYDWLIKQQVSL